MLGSKNNYLTQNSDHVPVKPPRGKVRTFVHRIFHLGIFHNQRVKALALLAILLGGTYGLLFSNVAQAAVTLRGSSATQIGSSIGFRGISSNNNGTGGTSLSINDPGALQNDVMIAGITIRGGSGTSITSVPTGWTLLDIKRDVSTTVTQVVYWKVAGASEIPPYTWNFTSNKASGVIMAFYGADTSSPIDVASGQPNTTASTDTTAPSITTTTLNDMLVGIFGTATGTTYNSTSLATLAGQNASTGGSAGTRTTTAGAYGIQAAAGATGTETATASASAVNIGTLVALKPVSATALSLSKPSGTVQNDVIVASITVPGSVTFTAPAGWTSIQRTVTAGNEITTQSWYLVAGAGEPSSYSWSWSGGRSATGGIVSYSGVDTSSPIDASASQANASSTTLTAPSVTTTGLTDKLVAVYGL